MFQELVTVLDETQPRRIVFDPVTPLLMTGSASGGAFRERALLQSLSSLRASTRRVHPRVPGAPEALTGGDAMGTMLGNYWTTIIGVVGGVGTYVATAGVKMPANRQEWIMFWVGAVMAGLGIVSKDATTGSPPK